MSYQTKKRGEKATPVSTQTSALRLYAETRKAKHEANVQKGKKLAEMAAERRIQGVANKKPRTKSQKASIFFPVQDTLKRLKKLNPHCRVQETTAVMLAAVLEYLAAEMLELAGNCSRELKKRRIMPRHINLAIKNDQELEKLCDGTILVQSGVVPFIHPNLLKNPKVSTIEFKTSGASKKRKLDEHEEQPKKSTANPILCGA